MIKTHYRMVNIVILLVLLIFISCISVGYAALNANLTISGDIQYESVNNLYNIVKRSSKGMDSSINFADSPTTATSGVYEMSSTNNDRYPIYYYRGIVTNNNVSFANFCWKIVRTTETGGVKLIYNGKIASNGSCNNTGIDTQIGESIFNNFSSIGGVGYVYNGDDLNLEFYSSSNIKDSTIKTVVETWYKNNMTSYTKMLENTGWFIDMDYECSGSEDEGNYSCMWKNSTEYDPDSKFIVSSYTKYPVALLTSGEMNIAGLDSDLDSDRMYLRGSDRWWTMSPSSYFDNYALVVIRFDGMLAPFSVMDKAGVRPVISLATNTIIKGGNGSFSSPYQILVN